ncbi:cobalt ABC transporter permease [Rhodobacter sp. TJ_12]|uniref:cobalt ABC transporter permease n=1 Tax=Rhodobacter sp. TJ_12 TaxID=2029399 RepID=UPI001CBB04CE|nr:cobalt ABC transporter permease [Rhodobacter sp. TJ_12]MBZ4021756.1 cobalt ABC transporter permease [Rhodobacter sp. TJ_12]
MKRILLSTVVVGALLAPLPALAHKVIASVFPSGKVIEGEVGFSDGKMGENVPVAVTAPDGTVLATVTTDDEGYFSYSPTQAVDLTFRADFGAGHVAETMMPKADVAKILGKAEALAAVQPQAAAPAGAPHPAAPVAMTDAERMVEREAIAAMLRDELRPLRKEIAAYKEKNDLQTILGGIGYIVGLFGLGFYMAAKRRLARG